MMSIAHRTIYTITARRDSDRVVIPMIIIDAHLSSKMMAQSIIDRDALASIDIYCLKTPETAIAKASRVSGSDSEAMPTARIRRFGGCRK